MIKKTITYTDYDGNQRTEDYYFNLNKAEVIEMEFSIGGGLSKSMERMSQLRDTTKIVPLLKDIVLRSYGEKSGDGKHFVKSEEFSRAFEQSEAYSELMVELLSNADEAAKFISGIAGVSQEDLDEVKKKANISALPSTAKA